MSIQRVMQDPIPFLILFGLILLTVVVCNQCPTPVPRPESANWSVSLIKSALDPRLAAVGVNQPVGY